MSVRLRVVASSMASTCGRPPHPGVELGEALISDVVDVRHAGRYRALDLGDVLSDDFAHLMVGLAYETLELAGVIGEHFA